MPLWPLSSPFLFCCAVLSCAELGACCACAAQCCCTGTVPTECTVWPSVLGTQARRQGQRQGTTGQGKARRRQGPSPRKGRGAADGEARGRDGWMGWDGMDAIDMEKSGLQLRCVGTLLRVSLTSHYLTGQSTARSPSESMACMHCTQGPAGHPAGGQGPQSG